MNLRTAVNVLISLLLAAGFLALAFRHVSVADLAVSLHRFDARWLVPALAISLALQACRAFRWQLELQPLERIPFRRLWVITSVAYMAINLLPARLGEVIRPWLLSRNSRVPFSSVVGNLVIEKTIDSQVLVAYILLGLITAKALPPWVRHGAMFPAIGALLLATLVGLLWWRGERFIDRWVVRYLPPSFGSGLLRVLRAVIDGMRIIPNARLLAAVVGVSFVLWFLPILSSYVMICAFNFDVPFSAALIVFIFIGFGTALPQAPGMIGAYQYACILALGLFGVPQADALAYGLVLNAIQLLTLVGQGIVALPFANVSVEELLRARRSAPQTT